jgi:quercetin 2,3-dioxygenase
MQNPTMLFQMGGSGGFYVFCFKKHKTAADRPHLDESQQFCINLIKEHYTASQGITMSDLLKKPQLSDSKDCPEAAKKPIMQKIATRTAHIGENLTIRRALPSADRRMIGAWCFFDHFGPLNLNTSGLNIAPHPHMGLQTFTWTLHGDILHRDSLGSEQIIQPGQVNLMTSGYGISHSEESLPDTTLHGVQLWIALPDSERNRAPDFIHYEKISVVNHDGLAIHILAGELLGVSAPTKVYTPLAGFALQAQQDTETVLPLNPSFEYGILPLIGTVEIENESIDENTLLYLGCNRTQLSVKMKKGNYALIIGGEPFEEEILMWWNFVARSENELREAIHSWEQHERFGEVIGYQGDRLNAPAFP